MHNNKRLVDNYDDLTEEWRMEWREDGGRNERN